MTMPNANPADIPKDTLQVSNLGASTQNLTTGKVTNTAKGRMSSSFLGSAAGLPGGVATTASNMFGQFAGKIADDTDPTTVSSPADVNTQVMGFFGNPGTSILDLVFGALISALGGIPIIGGVIASLAGWLNGTNDTANAALDTVVTTTTQVTHVQQIINTPTGVGLWETGPDPTGIVSFPFSQLAAASVSASHSLSVASGGGHTHSISSTSGPASTGTAHTHTAGNYSINTGASAHTHTLSGSVTVSSPIGEVWVTSSWAAWSAIRSPGTAERSVLTFVAKSTGTVDTFSADVYRMEDDGSVSLIVSTADNYAADLTANFKYIQMTLPTAVPVEEGDVVWVQWRMTGAGSVQIAAVNLPIPDYLDGFYPRGLGAGRNPSTPAPSTINAATFNGLYQGSVGWVSFGIDIGQTDLPRFFFDDFNRAALGNQWLTGGTSVVPRIKDGYVELQTDLLGTTRRGYAMPIQSMRSDVMSVEADVTNTSARSAGLGACLTQAAAGVWLMINTGSAQISTGGYGSYTTRASVDVGGPAHWKLAYDNDSGVWTATKNGEDIGLSWTESGVPHGKSYRRCGLSVLSTSASSARIDNFICQDIAEEEDE